MLYMWRDMLGDIVFNVFLDDSMDRTTKTIHKLRSGDQNDTSNLDEGPN